MKKQNRSTPAKSPAPDGLQDDTLIRNLAELAVDLRTLDEYAAIPDELKKKRSDFRRLINKCLQQSKDAVLHEAIDQTSEDDESAGQVLRTTVEELAGTIIVRREEGADVEVNAFVIPLFMRTAGGLRSEQCFQDEKAFDLLRNSVQEGGLESRQANVVLVSHAYHLDEIERIGYSQLHAMVQEAFASMTRKKAVGAPAIERSMSGWPENHFAPDDLAVELRFLLGFALKELDDPFYQIPEKPAAAERYFDARALRFQRWAEKAAPLVKRCLVTDGREADIDFLYQDLFHGGKAAAVEEAGMLQMMSDLQQALQSSGLAPEATRAVLGPSDADEEMLLQVKLYAEADGRLVASSDKPMGVAGDLQAEADNIHDALQTLGIRSLALAAEFDAHEQPVATRPYTRKS